MEAASRGGAARGAPARGRRRYGHVSVHPCVEEDKEKKWAMPSSRVRHLPGRRTRVLVATCRRKESPTPRRSPIPTTCRRGNLCVVPKRPPLVRGVLSIL